MHSLVLLRCRENQRLVFVEVVARAYIVRVLLS